MDGYIFIRRVQNLKIISHRSSKETLSKLRHDLSKSTVHGRTAKSRLASKGIGRREGGRNEEKWRGGKKSSVLARKIGPENWRTMAEKNFEYHE